MARKVKARTKSTPKSKPTPKSTPKARRNPLAAQLWRQGRRVKPSAKTYSRKTKHRARGAE